MAAPIMPKPISGRTAAAVVALAGDAELAVAVALARAPLRRFEAEAMAEESGLAST